MSWDDERDGLAMGGSIVPRLQARIAELEAALRTIASGEIDEGGNRRNHPYATIIARSALGLER